MADKKGACPAKLLPVSVVARRLGVSTSSVYTMLAGGVLPFVKLGPVKCYRVPESALDRLLADR